MERTISDFFSLLGDPRFLLGSALALVLLNYLLWELLHSHPVGERISRSLWGRHLQPPILPKILARLRPVAEWVRSRVRDLEATQLARGISMQLLPSTEKRVPRVHWHSIRQLLCDDSTCVICDRAAREASQYTGAVGRPSSRGSVDLNLGLPERKRHQRFKRSASAPAPTSVPLDLGPVRSVYCSPSLGPPGIKKDQSFPFEEPAAPDWDERSHSSSHQVGVQALASSSSTFAASHFTWGKSSSGSSEFSVGSLALSASSICRLQMSLAEQEYSQGSSWTERKASSEHQRGQWERPVPPKNSYSHSLLRTAPRSPAGASEGQAAEFTTADTPFLEDAAIASLESHVLVKRVQHHLGLPVTLLRSLRSFMLPAPDLTSRRRLREFGVVTRPQALPFLGSGTRKKLELHLNRMVRVKQWQLPQKIQGALGQMKPPWQSREKRPLSAVRKQGPGATGQVKGARRRQRTSAKLPTTAGVLDSKTNPASQAELQSHLVKKSLEIRLETFPAIVGHSQKMSSRSRVPRLPKSIPLGQSFPQLRNRLCLVLRSKADIVDMNIKCKYIHFLWGLPSLYMQSLSKMVPRAPAVPMSPTWMHATVEFVSMDPPFAEIRDLECHVLRKRLQHQWGLPGLVLQSVKQFLMPQLSLPARATSVLCSRLEVKILIGDTLFLLANVKEKLEAHVKTKIIERRWGLPRRALDSLRVFIPVPPPPAKRPRENEKTFALPQGEKPAKRKPSARTPRASRKQMVSSGKALQRHLTKKALEVRLGTIAPMAQRSWAAVRQGWKKHTLPKVIPPGFKPLVPRPQELLFMDLSNLGNLQLNIVHKGLVYRWGLLTVYNKSLARLFQDTGPPAAIALSPSKPTEPKFTAIPTPFISRRNREVLEWHVRRKNLQHTWGLPGLIQRSLRCLLPTAPSFRPQKGRHAEVAVSLTEPTFLSDAARRELERNVQKRILNQQWQLPRRVLASLRLLRPPWKADALGQKPRGFPFAQSKGSCPRKAGHPNHPAGSMKDALCTNCYMEELGAAAPQRSQAFPTLGSTNVGKMALHWTKKSVEVQLEVFPAVVKRSWKCTALTSGQRLPKLVPPGREPLQPRKCSLPFVSREDAGRMEVAVRLSHLASLWGLGTRYVEGLHAMIPSAAIQSLGRRRRVALEFFEGKVSFLDGPAREALELHVRKKRLQHEWGLPVLIHRSIKAFVQGSPLAPVFRKTMTHIQTLQQDLAFLPRGTCGRLEYHLQRLKLQRQWGLPRRVLKSLHSLVPETDSPPMGRMMKPSRRSLSTESGSRLHRRLGTKGAMDSDQGHKKAPERVDTALCPTCQGSALKGAAAEKLRQHLAKKSVEVHLEVLPAIARLSWRHASLSSKQPLPKLVPPGHRVLEPRQSSFPFLRAEEMDRVELALRCSRLASLWGLGTLYMEAIVAMVPRMPFHPVKSRRAAFGLPAGKPTFPGLDLATLEMHIKKKRLQHEWGLPSLALRSLGGFMQGAPARPHLSKTVIDPNVLPQALTFLPWATRSHLEFHVQRMKLQRAWGLPARILASLKAFVPSASFETSPFTLCYEEERSELVESSPGETQQPSWAGKMAKCFSSKHKAMENHLRKKYLESGSRLCGRSGTKGAMDSDQGHKEAPERVDAALCPTCQGSALNGVAAEKLRQHLAKKSVEVHLEVLPAVARLSWRRASLSSKQPLPKLVPPGHRVLEPRQSSFPFLRAEEMDRVELALRCSRLASLWGLGTRYTEVIVAMVPRMPFHPVKSRRAAFGLPTGKPNFPGLDLATLEMHVKKKRLQHEWGLPSLALRSLGGFMQGAPARPHRSKTVIDPYVLPQALTFLPRATRSCLEFHVQRMKLQRAWGLPVRILASLKVFVPSASFEMSPFTVRYKEERSELVESSPGETQQPSWAGKMTRCFSSKQKGMENHLRKKYLETRLEAFPTVVSWSQAAASGWEKTRLPKLVRAGQKHPRSRAGSLSFLLPATVDLLEVNVKHKHLAFLWGLPNLFMEPLSMFVLKGHPPVRVCREKIRFQEAKTPFCQKEAREGLEHHILKKRLHHHWGLPSVIQRSLRAWAPALSAYARPRQKISTEVNILVADIPFVPVPAQKKLETSLKKMIVHGRWGLPKRLQGYVRAFAPTPLADRELLITRPRQVTSVGLVSRQAPSQTLVPPILGLFRSSKIRTLENHLNKKSLEIKFQLPSVVTAPIEKARLPKRPPLSPVMKPRGAVLFVEPEALWKITLNIKRKYLTYLWGLPTLHTKSLKKMFGAVPEWSQKKTLVGKEAIWTGHGATRPGKWTGNSADFGSRSFPSFTVKPSFLMDEALDLLESHVRHKKLQHEWGLPATIQKSLRAFAPVPEEGRRGTQSSKQPARRPCCMTVSVAPQSLLFLDPAKKGYLEEHLRNRTVVHRWGIPKRVQQSLKMFLPPASLSQRSQDRAQTLLCRCDKIPPEAAIHPQSKAEGLQGRVTNRGVSPRRGQAQEGRPQQLLPRAIRQPMELSPEEMHQDKTPRHGRKTPERQSLQAAKFPMRQTWDLLEFHIRRKRIQHEWGLPSIVQKSLRAFSPLPPDSPASMRPRPGAYMAARSPRVEGTAAGHTPISVAEVSVPPQALVFLDPDVKNHLEAHVRSRTVSHKWGLPKLVQDSLRAFLPPGLPSQTHHSQSHQQHETHSDREGEESPEILRVKRRMPEKRERMRQETQVVATRPGKKATTFASLELKPSFLPEEVLGLLAFHIQHKKVQHLWGRPSIVLKSMHAFAPFPHETEKNMKRTGKITMETHPWVRGEVQAVTPSLLFLSPDTTLHLEAHLSNMVAKHRWGLPALVQHSLKAFLPPPPSPPSKAAQPCKSVQVAAATGGHHEDSKREAMPGRRKTVDQESIGQKKRATGSSSPAGRLPFLTAEVQELLEFHVQRKKVQHMWGLPSAVLRSLHAFAPFPFETEKNMQHIGKITTETHPWVRGEVRVIMPSLLFMNPDKTLHLEAHLSNMVAKHRWGLPALVQHSLKAFLPPPPSPPSKAAQPCKSVQVAAATGGHHKDSKQEAVPGRKKTVDQESNHQKKRATASSSPAGRLPFLTAEVQELLEFHVQRKKVQHMWGLPSAVLRSLHAFAPFPFETEKKMQRTGKITTEMHPWVRGEVRVIKPSLMFLTPDATLHLEAHLSNMVAKHRWGLPALVQHSLKAFLLSPPSSPSEAAQGQPVSAQPGKSVQVAATGGGHREDSMREATPGRRKTGNRENIHQKKQATASSSPVGRLPFLTAEAQELLEFHMQRKKVQHLWGLPSIVLKSLRAFAPFPREPVTRARDATVTLSERRPWDTEVRVPVQSLLFLGADTKERLEAHVRSRTAEHRWGLPNLVQKSLQALLPPASLSHPGEVNKQPPLHRHSESPQAPVRRSQITTERSVRKLPSRGEIPKEQEKEKPVAASAVPRATSLRAKLPFLTDSNQDALEFHIQRKKIQHEWGLPLMVQRSVHAFAPVPPELHQGVPSTGGESAAVAGAKDTVGEMGVGTKKPWIPGTVNIDVPSLHFLGPDTKENLEAHLRNLTIEHRWGLPRLVHKSMRAFIPFPSHLDVTEMEDQERPSVYSYGKTVMASDAPFPTEATEEASSEDQRTYHSTPLEEMEQGGGTDSRPDTEEPLFYPGTKPEYAMAIQGESGGWKAGRESTQRSTLQKRPHLMKATQRQKSMLFGPKRNPSISSLSSSRPGPRKYRSSASSRSMNLPRARDSSTRIPSGRTPIPRSSKTAFRNGKGMSREVEFGFQRMAEGSHPRAGLKEPQAQDISSPGWELGSSQKGHAYPCACYLRAHKDDSGSSLPSDAEQRWGMAKGTEPDLSGYPVPQDTGFSSEESPATGSHQEPEFPSARIMPESADAAPQCHVPISKEAESSLVWPSTVVQPHALYEDTSAGPRRQASRMHREKTNSSLPMRGSRPGGNWEKKKVQPHLPRHQPPSRALRRRSSKDLCEACRGQKPPPHPKGAASRSRGSREFNQHRSPAPQNQGSLGKEGGLQGHPEHPLQAMMGDKATERKAEGVTVSPSKAPRPLSTGAGSQFSTECESERVGDWDTEEENAGRRNTLRKEEGGGTKRAGEMRRTETSTKAQGSPKRAASPAATQSQKASPKSVVLHKEGPTLVKTEKRRVLGPDSEGRRTVVRMQTVRVKGPEGGGSQGVRDEEEGVLHWRKGPSEKGRLPAKEALVRHGSRRPSRMPRGNGHLEREALKMVQEIGKGIWGGGQHAQFIQGVSAKDMHRKLSLLGTIVEKKLLLQQGFRVWVQNQEWEEGSRGRVQKSPGASRPPTSSATRVAQMRWVELECHDSPGVAKPWGAGRALPAGPQQQQLAGKVGAPMHPGYRTSSRRKKEVIRGRSRSGERRK